MKNNFYAVFNMYSPNTAVTNRALSYLDAWDKMGVKVTVVFMLPNRNFSHIDRQYKNISIRYMWDSFPFHKSVVYNILLFWYVSSFVKKLRQGDKVYCMGQSYLVNRLLKKNIVDVYHERTEHPQVMKSGKWPYRIGLNNYLSICSEIKGLFVISQNLKDYFVGKGIEESKVHIVNMTVDPSRFLGVTKKEHNHRYIAYCGKASNNKDGVDQLIKSFAVISPKHPDIHLYIIGQAPDRNEKDNNAELAEQLGIADKVVFTGVVPFQDMPQMLTDATILALDRPDNIQAKYGFPTKLGEYLLTGNPVVVTAVGDIPRFIEDGENGMVAKPDNPTDFASKIDWLLTHPEEAKEIGKRGKETALKNFNNTVEAKKIIDIMLNGD